jgi:hypothetical protein
MWLMDENLSLQCYDVSADKFGSIGIRNNHTADRMTYTQDAFPVFLSSKNSTILSGIVNTIIAGGSDITATTSNTLYTDKVNIKTITGGTAVTPLAVDSNGFVVDGTSLQFTGNTSGDCITDLWVTNVHGCSPITVHDTIQSITSTGSSTTSTMAFGLNTLASGDYSQAFGTDTVASGLNSHAQGGGTIASGDYSHAQGGSLLTSICTTFNETSETFVTPSYTLIGINTVAGYDTYRLFLTTTGTSSNIHTIYGNSGNTMNFPATYNTSVPFGADIGGTNPAFWGIDPTSQYDSWLTVGPVDGSIGSLSQTPGSFISNAWPSNGALGTTLTTGNDAVFWSDPNAGPTGTVCVAQITIPTGTLFDVRLNAQGRSVSGEDWYQEDIQITNDTPYTPQSPLPSGNVCNNDRADTDGSGSVTITDLNSILAVYGSTISPNQDINEDGIVNIEDVQLVLNAYGESVPMTPSTVVSGGPTIAAGSSSYAGGVSSIASGVTSFIHSTNSLVIGDRSVVLGGQGITGASDDTVYVPNLNINTTPSNDNSLENILVRDTDGTVKYRTVTSVTGGTSTVQELNDLTDVDSDLPLPLSAQTFADDGRILHYDMNQQLWVSDDIVTHGTVVINVYGDASIAKGTPVYLTGNFSNDLHEVGVADADDPTKMPVIGFAAEALTTSTAASKHVISFGKLQGIDTTSGGTISGGESWTAGDILYMNTTAGELTNVRPTGASTQIQRIAQVLRVDASGGQLFIFNTARSAGLPNLTENNIWVGNSSNQPVETALAGLGYTSKYVESFAFTAATTSTITHNLGSTDVMVQVKDASGELITPNGVNNYTTNSVDINVSATETMRIIIIG